MELVVVIIIAAILLSVALSGARQVSDTVKYEQAKAEMQRLATAIVGNPELQSAGVRADFGYVGDVGALPPDLTALQSNPGGYATWQGPYIRGTFEQTPTDFTVDPWGQAYVLSGVTITSLGSGTAIDHRFAQGEDQLLRNSVAGNLFDLDGTPPGGDFVDSLTVTISIPDGNGSMLTKTCRPDLGGYYEFDSVPVGVHLMKFIYEPYDDTLERFVVVSPGSAIYRTDALTGDIWYDAAAVAGLIAYYPFDELSGLIAHDATGNGNEGDLINMTGMEWGAGVVGGSLLFDGIDDRVMTDLSNTELILSGDYSTSVWVRPDPTQKTWAGIYTKTNPGGSTNHWNLQFDNAADREIVIYHSTQRWDTGLRLADIAGSWHQVGVVREGTTMRIYLDGALFNSGTLFNDPTSNNGRLYIGADRTGNNTYLYRGQIDDLRVFNRALSSSEMAHIFGAGV